jgi:hypothetical protein
MYHDGAFNYISPEWYDEWSDPATGQTYKDVAIGGALTTRPFFKAPYLRPLAASEDAGGDSQNRPHAGERSQSMTATGALRADETVSPAQFSELRNEKAIARLEKVAATFGEDSEEFADEVRERAALAVQMHESGIFKASGSPQGGTGASPFDTEVAKVAAERNLPTDRATVIVMNEKPDLYRAWQDARNHSLTLVAPPGA